MDEIALGSLRTLGLSLYEARLYLGLLERGRQNGNELSRNAGVPSSKVYSTLNKLAGIGVVSQVNGTNGAEYVAVGPDVVVDRLRHKYKEPLDYLEKALPTIAGSHVDATILSLSNWDVISDEARNIISRATQSIRISIWAESLDEFRSDLTAATDRGVEVIAMIYGRGGLDAGTWLEHSYRDIVAERIGGTMLTLVADAEDVLISHLPMNGTPIGIRSRNPVLCLMAEEYLHHDFVLEKAKASLDFDDWDKWWRSDPVVRHDILGRLLTRAHPGEPSSEDT